MFKTIEQIKAAKSAELVVFYNSHNADKPVKKFADRATAEKRCAALLPAKAAPDVAAVVAKSKKTLTKAPAAKKVAPVVEKAANAAGVSASWANPATHAARTTRNSLRHQQHSRPSRRRQQRGRRGRRPPG